MTVTSASESVKTRRWLPYAAVALILFLPGVLVVWVVKYANAPARHPLGEAASIAVLPFRNASGDPGGDSFCDGVGEEIGNTLAEAPRLRVSGRDSALQFQGKTDDVRGIARALGVGTVLEGDLAKSGERLRIHVRLLNAQNGSVIWAQNYDRPLRDVFVIEDEISRAVAKALEIQPAAIESARRYHGNVELYQLYLEGLHAKNSETAGVLFQQVVQKDPAFAPAWTGLAECSLSRGGIDRPKARESAQKALHIDDTLARAHAALGAILADFYWDREAGRRELERALQINPNLGAAHGGMARYYISLARFREAEAELKQWRLLDPLSPKVEPAFVELSFFSRQYDRAIEFCRPGATAEQIYYLGRSYAEKGRLAEAIAALERVDHARGFGMLANLYARTGRREDALRLIAEAKAQGHVSGISMAQAYAGLGDSDEAFRWLERACEEREAALGLLRVEPAFNPLRGDRRFRELLARVHL